MGTGEYDVCQVIVVQGEDLMVSLLDMGMGAVAGDEIAIQVPSESDFIRGGYGVDIKQDDRRFAAEGCEFRQSGVEGVFQNRHERSSLEVQDCHRGGRS